MPEERAATAAGCALVQGRNGGIQLGSRILRQPLVAARRLQGGRQAGMAQGLNGAALFQQHGSTKHNLSLRSSQTSAALGSAHQSIRPTAAALPLRTWRSAPSKASSESKKPRTSARPDSSPERWDAYSPRDRTLSRSLPAEGWDRRERLGVAGRPGACTLSCRLLPSAAYFESR